MSHIFAVLFSILGLGSHTATLPATSTAPTLVVIATTTCVANQALPDLSCTPGAVLTTDVSVICVPGYSSKTRDVSDATKEKVFAEYGIPYAEHANYEVDHLISLELGGSNNITNLWPEAHDIADGSFVKDGLENHLHAEVCSGDLSLADAQHEIATNWIATYAFWKNISNQPASTIKISASSSTVPISVSISSKSIDQPVKESTSGICHPPGDPYYSRTTHFNAFSSMADCIAAGGKTSAR